MDPNNGEPSGFVYLVAEPQHNGMALDQMTVQQQRMPLHLLLKSEGIRPWLLSTLSIINQSPDAFPERKEGVDYLWSGKDWKNRDFLLSFRHNYILK